MSVFRFSSRAWLNIFLVITVSIMVALVLSVQRPAQSDGREETYRQLTLFGDVFQRVRAEYVEQV